ncbi:MULTISPECIES: J domain-containing protein [unclassified Phenylobacterium]|uniref:J domain-containing protein n=1 Tax=unclassified Phenylobacterium TaxID=2640670 RepID=UPI0022B5DBF0|nr:J domain-containing protein [Phenylobacterium sp. NIBR 498073]MBS0488838.1 J domain-containing protein [Pseudomonadota bacterium]WGU41460.1 J domain-containing protein [Phenylobacterium sp. NIBR 498073]
MARDPYQELGVSRSASADEIRKAFRKLAKQHHPDTNPGDKAAEERFKQVSAAFDILGDAEKRKKFDAGEIDADGRETMRGFGGGGGPFGQQGGPWGGQGRYSETMEGGDLGDLFSEILGRRGGGGGGFGGFSQRGSDVRAKLEIDLEEAIHGAKKRIAFSDGRTIDVTIPKGAEEGQTLRLKGQGSPGRGGPGDAFIELVMRPHPIFRREGEALVMDLPVSIPDAVLGGKVEARTPDGAVTLTVPKGANSGQSLRLKGKGLSDSRGKRGDLLARIVLMLPDKPDQELEGFAERWRKERPYTPRKK